MGHIFALLGHFSNHSSNGSHAKGSRISCAHKKTSQWDVPVLSGRSQLFLIQKHLERSSKAAVLERHDAHVAHCSACRGALRNARVTKQVSEWGVAAALLLAGAVARARAAALVLAALGFAAARLCAALEHAMTVGMYPPPRNA